MEENKIYGLDLLALPRYINYAVRAFPENFALGVFSSTFGFSGPAVERIIKTGKCPRVRVNLLWTDNHSYSRKLFSNVEKEAKKWREIVKHYSTINWQFAPFCEHTLNVGDARAAAELVLEIIPDCTAVNSVMAKDSLLDLRLSNYPRIINEVHGRKAFKPDTNYNFSFDGNSCVDSDVETLKTKHNKAETFFFWDASFNGRMEDDDATKKENRIAWATVSNIRSVVALAGERGEVSLPLKWIYKSHAENTGDSRADKALFISPLKTDVILLKDGRSVVGLFKYHGPYSGGGHRYYSTKMGYQIGQKPFAVWANGECFGTINPAFRYGMFKK